MKAFLTYLTGLLFLLFSIDSFAQLNYTANGSYAGHQVWEADTVKITGDVFVNGTLVVKPGTYVEFQGHFDLSADSLVARGSTGDNITFTIKDTLGFSNANTPAGGWNRIVARYFM
jgi:hypothetical protein